MNALNQHELARISGGESPTTSWGKTPVGPDPAIQAFLDQLAAQQQAAYDAWVRSFTGGLAD
jgi:hypothetical protein